MACVFCQGVAGEIELAVLWESPTLLAFLDHRPVFPGHVLLIPKRHVVTLDELHPDEIPDLFGALRVWSRVVPRALEAQGTFVANNNRVSQSVPHLHWHIVPRRFKDGLKGFFWPRNPYTSEAHKLEVLTKLQDTHKQEEILEFWFGPEVPGQPSDDFHTKRWFAQDAEFDGRLREKFGDLVERAVAGELTSWEASARGRLALILLLDQFTRNLFRHTGDAFKGDERAQKLARDGVETGLDRELSLDQRSFFYLPFEHGESAEWQRLSLESYRQLLADAPEALKQRYQLTLDYAQGHADIIERFGRYPHRNEALKRKATAEEQEFLQSPGSSFW